LIRRVLFLVAIAVGATLFLRTFIIDTIVVASGSMEPTLAVGTHFWVNRLLYRFRDPERGEIIVFKSPVDGEKGLVKRVIGIPGDQIELKEKKVYVNEKLLEEPYTIYKRAGERLVGDNLGPIKVPDSSLFVLGDDRDESEDSTTWKKPKTDERIYFVPYANIKGKLIQIP
jgi:signal peptidase I